MPPRCALVGSCLLLLCTSRPWKLGPFDAALHPFGEVDELGMVGESAEAWALRTAIQTAAAQDVHALIEGQSGAGKELVAQGIHASSRRARRPIVSRNAATFPETLIDAELFGNAANYPNPGMRPRLGLIGEADGSTLFLDEIGELSDALQAHLLRVLDNGEYQRLGESKARQSDFRFIGATRRPAEVLRHDLLARLRVRIAVPGLNDRREDVPLLARYLLREIAASEPGVADRFFEGGGWRGTPRISPALVRLLVQYDYTMNVRELETLLRTAIADSPGNFLEASERLVQTPKAGTTGPVDPGVIPPEVIQECLDRHDGRQAEVWRELGLSSRHVLARLIKKHGLRT
ncbi:MAG: sigma-54-dependent Fis family transcriptional regulator [Deltaproteobacteria bacterium]|nr:sigma-54-dependent Fis family transcriptional regulator [Deltaproteobacteria bacterium]